MFRILFLGDIVGKPGRDIIKQYLDSLLSHYRPQFVAANCENVAGGLGVTEETAKELFSFGIDIMTSGNHIWKKREFFEYLSSYDNVIRPANYPDGVPGKGYVIKVFPGDIKIAVVNLQGRVFMDSIDCPFRKAEQIINEIKEDVRIIIVDFHAEASSEKTALAWYLDGRVSAVIGTHTHVQTSDARIMPSGTAYITDAGMTGSANGIIGAEKETVLNRFITGMPFKFKTAEGNAHIEGAVIDVDEKTGRACSITALRYPDYEKKN